MKNAKLHRAKDRKDAVELKVSGNKRIVRVAYVRVDGSLLQASLIFDEVQGAVKVITIPNDVIKISLR